MMSFVQKTVVFYLLLAVVSLSGCKELEKMTTARTASAENSGQAAGGESKSAYFAAGCFWGVEAAFRQVEGVTRTAVGYMGGHTADPTYKEVCTDRTGHAEAVKVDYDPKVVSYGQLLDVFWSAHDPTTVNRQGPDVGTQYRSAIFFDSEEEYQAATASRKKLADSGRFRRPIVTEIRRAKQFYLAEEYHQQYLEKRGLSSCHINLR
jgi:peptide-methionine (S)-S-oxide reductase